MSDHHLTPKARGGKETVAICVDCHRAIHAFFDNKDLDHTYNSIQSLQSHEKFAKQLAWLRKRPPGQRFNTKTTKHRKKRR